MVEAKKEMKHDINTPLGRYRYGFQENIWIVFPGPYRDVWFSVISPIRISHNPTSIHSIYWEHV